MDDETHQPGALLTNSVTSQPKPPRRCGRWSRLTALGATIHAHANPEAVQLYRPPAERGVRFVIDPTTGGYKSQAYDPEDVDVADNKLTGAFAGRSEE